MDRKNMEGQLLQWILRFAGISLLLCLVFGQPTEAAAKTLRVGYTDMPGYLTRSPDGRYSGYAYEYLRALAVYGGWEYEFVPGTQRENMQRLLAGEIDVLPGCRKTAWLSARVDFTEQPMGDSILVLAMRDGEEAFQPGRVLRIGYAGGNDAAIDRSMQWLGQAEGVEFQLQPYDLLDDMLKGYERQEVNGLVVDSKLQQGDLSVDRAIRREPNYLMVRKGSTELLQELDHAMHDMNLVMPDISMRLEQKYFLQKHGMPLMLSKAERAYLQQKKKLVMVASPGQKPYTYFKDGEHKGVIHEILKQVAEDLGIEIEVIETPTNEKMMELLESGEVDMVSDFYADFGWADEHKVNLTASYLQLEYVAITRKLGSLPEHPRVACVKGHFYTHELVEKMYDADQLVYFDSVKDCLEAVSAGAADVTYTKALTAQNDLWNGNYYDLATNGNIVFSHEVAMGVSKSADPILLRILNKEIRHIDGLRMQDIMNRELFATKAELNPISFIYNYPIQIVTGALFSALLVLLGIGAFWRSRRKTLRRIWHLAYEDQRTGMHNQHWFEAEVPKILPQFDAARLSGRLGIAVFGISRADILIEAYGRSFLAQKLKEIVLDLEKTKPWAAAIAVGSSSVRIFCLVCASEEKDLLHSVKETILEYDSVQTENMQIHLNLKAGICQVPAYELSIEELISQADMACNELHGTHALVRFFDSALQDRLEMQQKVEAYMEKALEQQEFQVWCQPKYDIRTQQCSGAEALVRWQSRELGFLMPGQFIEIFERSGFALKFDFYMLEQVCRMQRRRLDAGQRIVPVSVNQSRLHMTEKNYLKHMQQFVDRYRLPPGTIELELTETAFTDFDQPEQQQHALHVLHSLQQMGFMVSMDDFGSGYSSLTLLSVLPMDIMKLDRSLLNGSEASERSRTILANAIQLGNLLHMQVICEGIETKEQEELLLRLGCVYGQGFLFGRPMPMAEFEQFIEK